jgi:sec-independent protein translocase protein TatC
MANEPGIDENDEMSFLDHLEILRWHLVRSITAILLAAIGAFIFKGFIFDVIIFGPKQPNFITYRAICAFSNKLSEWVPALFPDGAICIGQDLPDLVNLTMAGQFSAHIMTSLIAGVIIAFPFILWEVWRFIKPGLRPAEQKMARGFIASASLLFFSGVLFGYYVISPLSINFFLNYQVSDAVVNSPTLSTYISLITSVVIACGAVFELPILIYFLTKVGLVTPKLLKGFRKHALVAALVLSAVITPPDVFSQILVSIPIMVLYELSIWISRFVTKREPA